MKPARPPWLVPGLVLVIVFQIVVLAMVYVNARIPVWTGQNIRLETRPVDPRSLFRGNYAFLNYAIARIPADQVNALGKPKRNQKVYVKLVPGKAGTHAYGGVSYEKPDTGLFIRGRIKDQRFRTSGTYRVRFGIEAYFAPKDKAIALEKQLRSPARAEVWISSSGKAALTGVIADD